MKFKITAVLPFCFLAATTVFAQSWDSEIEASGTTGYIPVFTSFHRVANLSIFEAPGGDVGIGTTTPLWPVHVFSSKTTGGNPPITIWAEKSARTTWGGVYDVASSGAGSTIALNGEAYSPDGTGVVGQGGGRGVIGATARTDAFAVGTLDDSQGTTGSGVGIFGEAWSPQGIAGLFINRPGGDILHGAVEELKSRADSGDAAARHELAEFLISGDPAAPGFDSAVSWLRSMASENVPDARFLLGYLYEHGKAVPHDYAQAFENYSASAHEGYAPAENNLGALYHHGSGVPRNLDEAFRWYRAAALKGYPPAEHNLGNFYYLGYATPVDYSQAVKWFRAAAEQGLAPAQSSLAYCYIKGVGVSTDYDEAVRWARLAADQGHPHAEALLGYLYEKGKGLPLNYISAYVWYSRAAAAGDASSPDRLKSLSRIMTRKQLDQANSFVASQSNLQTSIGPWEK